MWYEKLNKFFKERKISNRQLSVTLGYSETMIGRYLKGRDNINAEFIGILIKNYPEINLQYMFSDSFAEGEEEVNLAQEQDESYNFNVIKEIEDVEKKLNRIKAELAKKSQ
jgi:transcriptional regulator with XRE-family HTH domain